MSLIPTNPLSGLTSFLKGLNIPPCLVDGGKIYGGISLSFFVLMMVTGKKKTYNGFRERIEEGLATLGMSLIWPVFLYWMFDNDDGDDIPLWVAYAAHRKEREGL